jgi:hypothetical protein
MVVLINYKYNLLSFDGMMFLILTISYRIYLFSSTPHDD